MRQLYQAVLSVGADQFQLLASEQGLVFVGSPNASIDEAKRYLPDYQAALKAQPNALIMAPYLKQLSEYFAGKRKEFDLAVDFDGVGTGLQQAVWAALRLIPYGMTCDYTTIAQNIDRPDAIRAVATAIAKNPVLIVTPCHRVLRKDGGLGGYRGGLTMKKALLALEKQAH